MIRLPGSGAQLAPAEQFGLELLVDAARLVPMEDPRADVVSIDVTARDARAHGGGGEGGQDLRAMAASGWGMEIGDGAVRVPRSLLAKMTDVAGAVAEQRSEERDRHDRVPSGANPLVAAELERQPIVSLAARALREAVARAAGRRPVRLVVPWPEERRWAAAFTHDLDVVSGWPLFAAARWVELFRKGEARRAANATLAAARALTGSPVLAGLRWLLQLERTLEIRSTWFVLSGTPTYRTLLAGDLTYRPESRRARTALREILAGGHEVGLHGSFATMESTDEFRSQRDRLRAITGVEPAGVRQHFLRMRPGTTQRAMVEAGFLYDSTYGFPDRNGFRLGVADVVPAWDAARGQEAPMSEIPLHWMDRALSKYRGVEDPAAWVDDALALAELCQSLEGLWVGLWHPNLTPALGFPGAPGAYERLARTIVMRKAYIAPLGQIAAWRAARRAVRAERIAPDGSVVARRLHAAAADDSSESMTAQIRLEDVSGTPMEAVEG